MNRFRITALCVLTLLVNVALDRITKILAVTYLKGVAPISFLRDTVVLYYTENSGAFLSIGSTWPQSVKFIFLLIIPIVVCVAGLIYCCVAETDLTRALLIVTVLAGGMCNLFDRVTNNFQVIDFLNFGIGGLRTGVLNVADLSVTFGAILVILHEWKTTRKKEGN
jgi:signal peptidase II